MRITEDQKNRFNSAFAKLMVKATPALKKRWNGIIDWKDLNSFPEIDPLVISELTPAMKARYVDLLNKLSRGTL